MLSSSPVTTVLIVKDAERSVAFYREQLGLPHQGRTPDGQEIFTAGGGSSVALMSDPDAKPSGRTELSFEVSDIGGEIRDLESRGVTFEDYDLPGLTTVDHVAEMGSEKAAWFQDPDGNVLCLHELVTTG
jgi:catechol 2,3-dioxygenase-like lactoylglutathione lyase family enzyme